MHNVKTCKKASCETCKLLKMVRKDYIREVDAIVTRWIEGK